MKWTFAFAFSLALLKGDLTPSRGPSKLFVSVYALASVALVAGALGRFVASFAEAQRELATRAAERMPILRSVSGGVEMHGDKVHHSALLETAEKALRKSKSRLRSTAALLFGVIAMSTLIYAKFFQKLGIIDVFYFVCVSMSTVGLGDLHPKSTFGKIYATIWLVFASLGFANLIAVFTEVRLKKKELDITKALVSEHLSTKTFSDIDEDGDQRLSESEFLGFTICKLGKATPDEVRYSYVIALNAFCGGS